MTENKNAIFDVLIIGGGVGGMSTAVYAKRRGERVAIIEKLALGGQALMLDRIENFPSEAEIDGVELVEKFKKQLKHLGVEIIFDEVKKIEKHDENFVLIGKKSNYETKKVVLATGLSNKTLGVGEENFLGTGVSYCAICDANFFKGKEVCVASKNGSGYGEAKILSKVCSKVTLIDSEDVSKLEKANQIKNIDFVSNANIVGVFGDGVLKAVEIEKDGESVTLDTSALFIAIGKKPNSSLLKDISKLDQNGFVVTDENMTTSTSGVFAVGDVRNGVLKQIVTACADGSIAGTKS